MQSAVILSQLIPLTKRRYLEIGDVNAAQLGTLLGEQLDADVGDLTAPLHAEPLEARAANGDLGEPDVGDAEALIHDELPEPRRRSERGHLPVPDGDAVGEVDGLQPGARRHERLQAAPPDAAGPRQPHPADGQQRRRGLGQRGGEGGVVEARAGGEVERGERRERAQRPRERLPAEHPRGAAGRGLGAREAPARQAARLAVPWVTDARQRVGEEVQRERLHARAGADAGAGPGVAVAHRAGVMRWARGAGEGRAGGGLVGGAVRRENGRGAFIQLWVLRCLLMVVEAGSRKQEV